MKPTPAERAVIEEMHDWSWDHTGGHIPDLKLMTNGYQDRLIALAQWHLDKIDNEKQKGFIQGLVTASTHLEQALKTLRQISALPRGGRAKRLARAALRFLENVK